MSAPGRGLAQGGLGGPEDELLDAGQEEVFSRTEVESGRIEHHGGDADDPPPTSDTPSSPTVAKGRPNG